MLSIGVISSGVALSRSSEEAVRRVAGMLRAGTARGAPGGTAAGGSTTNGRGLGAAAALINDSVKRMKAKGVLRIETVGSPPVQEKKESARRGEVVL